MIIGALAATESLWTGLPEAFRLIYLLMHVLSNVAGFPAEFVERRFQRVMATMTRFCQRDGPHATGLAHFLKVTGNYRSGLFVCYRNPDVPRTDNDLEQLFGRYRHLERRASGRKVPAASLVVVGPVRLPAAIASSQRTFTAEELAPTDIPRWREIRQKLQKIHRPRILGRRFRRNSKAYLAALETRMLNHSPQALPP